MPSPFRKHMDSRLRRKHVADIREPLVKAVWYHREAQKFTGYAGPFTSDPEARERHDDWIEEAVEAQDQCDRILHELRSSRELERAINREAMTAPAVAGAVNLRDAREMAEVV